MISDFDYTLSRFHDASGVKCWTTHGIFDAPSTISSDLGNKVALLKAKYLPIEFDPHMSIAEKTPHMENWRAYLFLCHHYTVVFGVSARNPRRKC